MQINILIVDDVKANLISLEALLETIDQNYNIIQANSGSDALEITLFHKVDLIILDIQMPDMDGFEVAQLLKGNKKTANIPVIFLTAAFKSNEWKEKGFALGAVDYLTKPIDENQFINRIHLYSKLIKTIDENRYKDKLLNEQSKMASMGEMIGNIAHQWRQPLSVISTAATGIQVKKEYQKLTDEFLNDMLDKINNSTQYLSQTIDDFRDFIKGDTQAIEFNVSEYLNKAFIIEEAIIKKNSLKIIENIDKNITVNSYGNLFLQVMVNILNNAKDALKSIEEDERYIWINLFRQEEKIILTILDNAGGIEEDILPKVFDAYFTTKHKSLGTGLGLYMTYNMIQNMHGSIDVENTDFDYNGKSYKGALFTIII